MLTIKSRFVNFRDKQGETYTAEELDNLYKALILPDIVNFPKNKNRNFGYGFTKEIAAKVYDKLTLNKNAKILIINDISLQMYNKLTDEGYKRENIYLAFGKWNKNAEAEDCNAYEVIEDYIKYNFADELNIIKLKEIFTMGIKIDGIIANPPYGAIGANITKTIIDNMNFDEYINLEPSVDYITKTTDKLKIYNHIELNSLSKQFGGFEDAAVIPSIMRISKYPINDLDILKFYLCTTDNALLKKYFKLNSERANVVTIIKNKERQFGLNTTNALFFGQRVTSGNHGGKVNLIGGKNTTTYKLNHHLITLDDYYTSKNDCTGRFRASILQLDSANKYSNALKFIYSELGAKFCNLLGTAMNRDFFEDFDHLYWFPKVDWTRSWTVEEILADYGYTETEIQAVMDDLKNFKGMDD